MRKNKTYDIGETCVGGTIKVKLDHKKGQVNIRFCEYKTNKTVIEKTFKFGESVWLWGTEYATSYDMDNIEDFINENTPDEYDI